MRNLEPVSALGTIPRKGLRYVAEQANQNLALGTPAGLLGPGRRSGLASGSSGPRFPIRSGSRLPAWTGPRFQNWSRSQFPGGSTPAQWPPGVCLRTRPQQPGGSTLAQEPPGVCLPRHALLWTRRGLLPALRPWLRSVPAAPRDVHPGGAAPRLRHPRGGGPDLLHLSRHLLPTSAQWLRGGGCTGRGGGQFPASADRGPIRVPGHGGGDISPAKRSFRPRPQLSQ